MPSLEIHREENLGIKRRCCLGQEGTTWGFRLPRSSLGVPRAEGSKKGENFHRLTRRHGFRCFA